MKLSRITVFNQKSRQVWRVIFGALVTDGVDLHTCYGSVESNPDATVVTVLMVGVLFSIEYSVN